MHISELFSYNYVNCFSSQIYRISPHIKKYTRTQTQLPTLWKVVFDVCVHICFIFVYEFVELTLGRVYIIYEQSLEMCICLWQDVKTWLLTSTILASQPVEWGKLVQHGHWLVDRLCYWWGLRLVEHSHQPACGQTLLLMGIQTCATWPLTCGQCLSLIHIWRCRRWP